MNTSPKEELPIKSLKLMRNGIEVLSQNWLQSNLAISMSKALLMFRNAWIFWYNSLHSRDVIFLTKTWLYPSIKDSEIFPLKSIYRTFSRHNRLTGEHSGVLIATKKVFQFNHSEVSKPNDNSTAIYLFDEYSSHMFLLIYNPPTSSP